MEKKEAMKILKDFYDKSALFSVRTALDTIIPELKESEDERIREALVRFHKSTIDIDGIKGEDIIAWLEKQGENHADKVEPKFKVGDWVVYKEDTYQIHNISLKKYYECLRIDGTVHTFDFECIDSKSHLWTIQDAKDGDVLASKKGNPFIYDKYRYNNGLAYYYAGLDANGKLTLKMPHNMLSHFGCIDNIHPATKEQCNLLFQKMKEAGYEWNAEKKELNKVLINI